MPPDAKRRPAIPRGLPGAVAGYVYLVSDGRFVKIGRALCPVPEKDVLARRIAIMQTGNANGLDLRAAAWVKDAASLEYALHIRMARRRVRGEWFILSRAALKVCTRMLARLADAPSTRSAHALATAASVRRLIAAPSMPRRSGSRVGSVDVKDAARREVTAALRANPDLLDQLLRPPRVVCGHRSRVSGSRCCITTPHEH